VGKLPLKDHNKDYESRWWANAIGYKRFPQEDIDGAKKGLRRATLQDPEKASQAISKFQVKFRQSRAKKGSTEPDMHP